MKKLLSFTLMTVLLIAIALPAGAETTGGTFPADRYGFQNRYTTDMAPVSQLVVKVTKGFYNLDLSKLTQYTFAFTKTADDTAQTAICKMRVGGYTTGSEEGIPTTGTRYVKGTGVKFTGFTCASTAGTNINFLIQ